MGHELEKRIYLQFQENRLATFKSWVFNDNESCNKLKLAEAGFHFIGNKVEPDAVECFLCEKSLDGWEATDDPWIEHKKHSPNCQFAQLMSPENSLTYYQFMDISAELMRRIFNKMINAEEERVKTNWLESKKYGIRHLKPIIP